MLHAEQRIAGSDAPFCVARFGAVRADYIARYQQMIACGAHVDDLASHPRDGLSRYGNRLALHARDAARSIICAGQKLAIHIDDGVGDQLALINSMPAFVAADLRELYASLARWQHADAARSAGSEQLHGTGFFAQGERQHGRVVRNGRDPDDGGEAAFQSCVQGVG